LSTVEMFMIPVLRGPKLVFIESETYRLEMSSMLGEGLVIFATDF
jgi:hypothetical protein